jgi:hypothetical protein
MITKREKRQKLAGKKQKEAGQVNSASFAIECQSVLSIVR